MKEKAKQFALKAHHGQKYGEHDYSFHLQQVVATAEEFGLDEKMILACWLHDTMEDCGSTFEQLEKEFGKEVADMVFCVTDEPGKDRKERKLKTYPKIAANEKALCVKLCDRIANLAQTMKDRKTGILEMYLREHTDFRAKLYHNRQGPKTLLLWEKLEKLVTEAQTLAR
jgi:(p)ppGpp synthase/HD superfamily hydrolase